MTDDINSLPDDPVLLKKLLAKQAARLMFLEEQFRLAQQQRFGASSEGHPAQGDLFNEAEVELDVVDEPLTEPTSTSVKKKPVRKKLPSDLPREIIIHDIKDKTCECCGDALHQMGEARSEKLEFIPAQVKVIEHIRLKYSCRACEKQGTSTKIVLACGLASPIPKGIATATLLSQIITSKYQYALPLYRQESLFKQYGIELNRKTMSDWMMKSADLFKPVYARLRISSFNTD